MRLRRRIMYDILNTPAKRLAAGILSVLCSICLLLLVVFFSVGKGDVKPAAAEQTAAPTVTASATSTVTTEPEPKQESENSQKVSDDRVEQLPAPQRKNSPERARAAAPPAVKPQIPPKPVGFTLPPIGGLAGKDIPVGRYIVFSDSGFVAISSDYRVWRYNYLEGNGRTAIFSLAEGDAVKFQGTAYTPEQVAILDQYYGGVG